MAQAVAIATPHECLLLHVLFVHAGTRRAGAGSGTPDGQRLRFLCNALKQSVPSLVASPSSEGDAVFD